MQLPDLSLADCLQPDWAVAPRVRALITTRTGGVSLPPYGRWQDGAGVPGGLDLGLHTGDDAVRVAANRARVLALTQQPQAAWLDQVHGTRIVAADQIVAAQAAGTHAPVQADACVSDVPGAVCVVMVADCLPVLICDAAGRAVGAAHAGWRGLVGGIVERPARRVADLAGTAGDALHAYLGPAIGPAAFEVGTEVRTAFLDAALPAERLATDAAFRPHAAAPDKYFADLYALARLRLARLGVTRVSGGTHCTFSEPERFYSYRRDRVTGRMGALIWLDA